MPKIRHPLTLCWLQTRKKRVLGSKDAKPVFFFILAESQLHQRILTFSISHDDEWVQMCGWYPIFDGDRMTIYCQRLYRIKIFDQSGENTGRAFSFSLKICQYALELLREINAIIDELPIPESPPIGHVGSLEASMLSEASQQLLSEASSTPMNSEPPQQPPPPPEASTSSSNRRGKEPIPRPGSESDTDMLPDWEPTMSQYPRSSKRKRKSVSPVGRALVQQEATPGSPGSVLRPVQERESTSQEGRTQVQREATPGISSELFTLLGGLRSLVPRSPIQQVQEWERSSLVDQVQEWERTSPVDQVPEWKWTRPDRPLSQIQPVPVRGTGSHYLFGRPRSPIQPVQGTGTGSRYFIRPRSPIQPDQETETTSRYFQ
jgi:hypothetical protein